MSHKVVDSRANAEENVENTGDPDELLCKCTGEGEVRPGQDQSDGQDENEQDYCICVKGEGVAGTVDTASTKTLVCRIPLERDARDCSKAQECQYELDESVDGRWTAMMAKVGIRVCQPRHR